MLDSFVWPCAGVMLFVLGIFSHSWSTPTNNGPTIRSISCHFVVNLIRIPSLFLFQVVVQCGLSEHQSLFPIYPTKYNWHFFCLRFYFKSSPISRGLWSIRVTPYRRYLLLSVWCQLSFFCSCGTLQRHGESSFYIITNLEYSLNPTISPIYHSSFFFISPKSK